MRKITSAAAAAAVVLTSIGLSVPSAEARGRYGYGGGGYGGWGYRHRDRIDAGDVIGGLLIIGTIAAIASAASKDSRDRRDRDQRYDPPYRDQDRRDAPRYRPYDGGNAYPGSGASRGEAEARAADACSWAVEGEMGDDARVDSITETRPDGGGWYVTGTASRLGGDVRSFGCSYRGGRVVDVSFR